jgi:hypothetical protein
MSIKSNVIKALTAATAYADAIKDLKKDCAGKSRDDVRAAMIGPVAEFYDVPLVDGAKASKGKKVFDSAAPKYLNAKQALYRLLVDVCGDVEQAKQEPVAVPAKVTKQVKVLVAEVIASGMTKAQFDAMVAELRASVSFK